MRAPALRRMIRPMLPRLPTAIAAAALVLLPQAGPAPAAHGGDWHPRAAELCLEPRATEATTAEQMRIMALVDRIAALQPGPNPLLQNIPVLGTSICIDDRAIEARGYFDVDANYIALGSELSDDQMLVILIHELRHLDQLAKGYLPGTDHAMAEAARFTFAMEADAQAIVALFAWQMREAGEPGPWNILLGFPRYTDIAEAFAETATETGDPALATGAAFDQWYASDWRRERYFTAAISDHLERLEASKALPSYHLLPEGYFDALCHLPDGGAYPCDPQGMSPRDD